MMEKDRQVGWRFVGRKDSLGKRDTVSIRERICVRKRRQSHSVDKAVEGLGIHNGEPAHDNRTIVLR